MIHLYYASIWVLNEELLICYGLYLRILNIFCLLLHVIAYICRIILEILGYYDFFSCFGDDAVLFFFDYFVKFPA